MSEINTDFIQKSIFPDLPRGETIADKNGNIDSNYQLYLEKVTSSLQRIFKSEGWLQPALTDVQIAQIAAIYTPYIGQPYNTLLLKLIDISGQMIFDSVNRVPKVFIITFDSSPSQIILTAAWKTYTVT